MSSKTIMEHQLELSHEEMVLPKHLHRSFLCETHPHRCRRLLGGLCWAQAADLCSVSGHVLLGGRPGGLPGSRLGIF